LQEKGENISLDNIYENILKRDRLDSTREISPLKKANDAIEVDTTGKNIEEVKNLILSLYRNKKNIGK
jgi:cytidylate kinase